MLIFAIAFAEQEWPPHRSQRSRRTPKMNASFAFIMNCYTKPKYSTLNFLTQMIVRAKCCIVCITKGGRIRKFSVCELKHLCLARISKSQRTALVQIVVIIACCGCFANRMSELSLRIVRLHYTTAWHQVFRTHFARASCFYYLTV